MADIVQLDATIDKFLDYARPDHVTLTPVNLHAVVASCVYAVQNHRELQITMYIPEDLYVMADEVELARVISNLLENARRYGKTADTDVTHVEIATKARENWVLMQPARPRHGRAARAARQPDPALLPRATPPAPQRRARGWACRLWTRPCSAWAASLRWPTASTGGLVAHIQLQRASELPEGVDPKQRLHRPAVKRHLPRQRAQEQA